MRSPRCAGRSIFPEYEVHFIAVNDGVDSQKGENDLTPFRNLFNEWYARDCSKKQRAVKRMKGMSGQRVSSHPPYGYIKGEDGQLVPDQLFLQYYVQECFSAL